LSIRYLRGWIVCVLQIPVFAFYKLWQLILYPYFFQSQKVKYCAFAISFWMQRAKENDLIVDSPTISGRSDVPD
jgi:hypothetical protein